MKNEELKRIRRQLGLTQVIMAGKIGVSRVYFGRLERGEAVISKTIAMAVQSLWTSKYFLTRLANGDLDDGDWR